MSKKKAFSGSTMSLKDFHGGSIPSDLRLPSAPGVIARSGSDRQNLTPWGNNLLRPENRTRPKSSGAAINLDEKASFLSHPSSIGRNFDEDERKPLDGVSVPRRTISDESIRAATPAIRQESKPDYVSSERHAANSVSQIPFLALGSFPVKLVGVTPVGVNSQTPSGNSGQTTVNSHQNAWGMRKEVMGAGEAGAPSVFSGPNVESKFAQASALEKVSSGKWQSKSPMQLLPHLLCSRNNDNNMSSGVDLVSESDDYDVTWGSHAERDRIAEDEFCGSGKQLASYAKERPQMCAADALTEPNFGGAHSQPVTPSEISARSKLKLLPISKPSENSETDQKKGYQQSIYSGKVETVNEIYGNTTPKSGSAVGEGGNQPVDRPKLNLKPRSKPLEQSKGSPERKRNTLFGGARPRELVLKERGIDDIAINNVDLRQLPNRVNDSPKIEVMRDHSTPTARHSEQTENLGPGKRIGRDSERKERWMDHEKADNQRNWRNDNRRSSRDADKQPQPLQQDKRPDPETWRKPAEQPKPTSADDDAGIRPGKVASALELAQTFSRSFSDPKKDDGLSGQRSLPGQNQTPFSRLTDARDLYSAPSARPRINGY